MCVCTDARVSTHSCTHVLVSMCVHVCTCVQGIRRRAGYRVALSVVTKQTGSDRFPQRENGAKRKKVAKSKFTFSEACPGFCEEGGLKRDREQGQEMPGGTQKMAGTWRKTCEAFLQSHSGSGIHRDGHWTGRGGQEQGESQKTLLGIWLETLSAWWSCSSNQQREKEEQG